MEGTGGGGLREGGLDVEGDDGERVPGAKARLGLREGCRD